MDEPERYAGPYDEPRRYALWGQVAGGEEGRVWRATRELSDGKHLEVAVKVLNPDRFGGIETPDQVKAKWSDQAARLRTLKSTGVVSIQETFEGAPPHDGSDVPTGPATLYFVMGWVEGLTLAAWAASHPADFERLAVLEAAAEGLDEIHSIEQAHADVKPANMVVTTRRLPTGKTFDSAVLVDFGLMRTVTGEAPSRVAGTAGYMAPELYAGGSYSRESDLYAFAGVVLFLLTNGPPVSVGDVQQNARRRLTEANVGEETIEAIVTALNPDPALRPRGARKWLSTVRSGLSSSMQPTVIDHVFAKPRNGLAGPVPQPAATPRPRRWIAALVVIVLALAVAGTVSRFNRGADPEGEVATDTPAVKETTTTSSSLPATTTSNPPPTIPLTTAIPPPAAVIPRGLPKILGVDIQPADASRNGYGIPPAVGPAAINGQLFDHVVSSQWIPTSLTKVYTIYVEYDLGKDYATFRSIAGQLDSSKQTSGLYRFDVLLDGVNAFSEEVPFGASIPIDLDVTGVLRIRLSMTLVSTGVDASTGWAEPTVAP